MKVYIVIWESQMDFELGGVYQNKEDAEVAAKALTEKQEYGHAYVQEYEPQ